MVSLITLRAEGFVWGILTKDYSKSYGPVLRNGTDHYNCLSWDCYSFFSDPGALTLK